MTTGIELIAAERKRQVEDEGWSSEHDDEHHDGELARAAACYADYAKNAGSRRAALRYAEAGRSPGTWPWLPVWWKPTTRLRMLVKAGALIAAEIDRPSRADPGRLVPPRGPKPDNIEGLNSLEIRVIPITYLLVSLALFLVFLVALHQFEESQEGAVT